MDPTKDKKSKWRLPGLSKSSPSHIPSDASDPSRNSTHDSTYSSTPSLTGSDASRAPHGQPISQETYRNDQGQTVTTTTTTTTTTVVTSGPEGHTSVTQHDPGASSTTTNSMESLKDRITEKFRGGTNTNERGGYRDEGSGMSHAAPQVPVKSSMRERSPNPQPPRSPTGGSNFSYPSRTPPPQGQGYAPPGMGPTAVAGNAGANGRSGGGTLQGLKSAAVGLHGVGETLRGTVNSSVDRRFKASPEAIAAHESVVRAGQEEMNSGRLHHKEAQVGGQAGGQVGHTGAKGGILKSAGRDASGRLRVVNE